MDKTTNTTRSSETKKKENKRKKKKKESTGKRPRSVLQMKLTRLALQIGYMGFTSALLTFVILVLQLAIVQFAINKNAWSNAYIKDIIFYLTQAITVVVVTVPEGLPLAVTLSLAFAVRQMTKCHNLVRHIDACETMGNATTICSDKTGTLTTNRMTAVQFWCGDKMRNVRGLELELETTSEPIADSLRRLMHEAIAVNTNYASKIVHVDGDLPKQIGNKTECALLAFVNTLGAYNTNDNKIELFEGKNRKKRKNKIESSFSLIFLVVFLFIYRSAWYIRALVLSFSKLKKERLDCS